jgi:hypothetical protein
MVTSASTTSRERKIVVFILTFFAELDEERPYFLFTHRDGGNQRSVSRRNEFGEECMLGKLCRLEKRCGRFGPLSVGKVATLASTRRQSNAESKRAW